MADSISCLTDGGSWATSCSICWFFWVEVRDGELAMEDNFMSASLAAGLNLATAALWAASAPSWCFLRSALNWV